MDIFIRFNTDHIKPEDTDMIFIGSGALSYAWYGSIECKRGERGTWWVKFTDGAVEEDGMSYTLNHDTILSALRTILQLRETKVNSECYQQCVNLVTNVEPELVDFDADTADQVMQVATFGDVIYG